MPEKIILVTGAAGFIGSHLCKRLIDDGWQVVGLDNLNDYYSPELKRYRIDALSGAGAGRNFIAPLNGVTNDSFIFVEGDLCDDDILSRLFSTYKFTVVVNLAAQAGVRYSIDNPRAYINSNLVGFENILECCRQYPIEHLVFASSSSVYGGNSKTPYSESDPVDRPVSLYAATKKANELMAHAYSKLYDVPCTGLRFFTVYGPAGRPDMAYYKFADKMVNGDPIQLYNNGDMYRDFTYVDDIVEGIVRVIGRAPNDCGTGARYKIYNIGGSKPIKLVDFVDLLECLLRERGLIDQSPKHQLFPMQPGDVYKTHADTSALESDFGFKPKTSLEDGLREFVRWYQHYHVANK